MISTTSWWCRLYDWMPAYDEDPRFLSVLGVANRVREDRLLEMRDRARSKWLEGRERAITMLVGGPNKAYELTDETAEELAGAARAFANRGAGEYWRRFQDALRPASGPDLLP